MRSHLRQRLCNRARECAVAISADATAAQLEARSLQNPELLRSLAENLGHDPEDWNFEALSWVAYYYHPSLAVARAQWLALRAAERTASARTNPTLALTPGFTTTPGETPVAAGDRHQFPV